VARAQAAGAYDDTLRSIVHAFKYDGRRSIASGLAEMMRERGAEVLDGAHAAVRSRCIRRGVERAVSTRDDLACHLGLPVVPALRRIRATATQTDLPAAQRHKNVQNAFALTRHAARLLALSEVEGSEVEGALSAVEGAHIVVVLVYDVSTTGATLDACAQVLEAGGVRGARAYRGASRGATALTTSAAISSFDRSPSSVTHPS
jgi:predicted amidophosphoribosyltransferase